MLRLCAAAGIAGLIVACGVSQQQPTATVPPATSSTPPLAAEAAATCDSLTPPQGSQFPQNFDYPQPAPTVQNWVQTRSGSRTRLHAYCLFAGLNQLTAASIPTWRTWATTTQAFPNQYNRWMGTASAGQPHVGADPRPMPINEARNNGGDEVGGLRAISNPPPVYGVNDAVAKNSKYAACLQPIEDTSPQLYSLKDGETFQSNGDIMIAAVSYNAPALTAILAAQLYNAATLDKLLPAHATSPSTSIASLPSSSIVLKVMLWPVAGGGSTWSSVTALPVWDWDANKPGSPADGQYAGYEMQNLWQRAAAISSSPVTSSGGVQRVQFLYGVLDPTATKKIGPNTYDNAQVVGLDRFYSRKYSQADLDGLSRCDRAILDASAYWTYNRAFQAGDSLALVAMHIMTKEQSDWTFQSAWWHPDALACTNNRFCTDRPASVPGGDTTWKNYMMTTTYGMTQQSGNQNAYAPPGTKGEVWPVAYNPYIELAASHPITTNCMNCHHRAAWPPTDTKNKPDGDRASTYLQATPPNPNALETFQTSNGVFNGLTMVDSMWAVSDRAGYSTRTAQAAPPAAPSDDKSSGAGGAPPRP